MIFLQPVDYKSFPAHLWQAETETVNFVGQIVCEIKQKVIGNTKFLPNISGYMVGTGV